MPAQVIYISLGIILLILIFVRVQPRRFYFVRHGETLLNAEHIRQGAEGALSPRGQEQAERAGRFLAAFPVKRIVSSTYERARETTSLINETLHVPVIYSELLIERRNPSEIIGKNAKDPEVISIVDHIDNTYHEDDFRFSDEENFSDLKRRARRALALLASQGADETVVVTHGIFLKMVIAYLLYRENLHAGDYAKLAFFNASDNANITICEYSPWKFFSPTRGWSVVSYNETP